MNLKHTPGGVLFLCEGCTRNGESITSVVANCDLANISKGSTTVILLQIYTIVNLYLETSQILIWCCNRVGTSTPSSTSNHNVGGHSHAELATTVYLWLIAYLWYTYIMDVQLKRLE